MPASMEEAHLIVIGVPVPVLVIGAKRNTRRRRCIKAKPILRRKNFRLRIAKERLKAADDLLKTVETLLLQARFRKKSSERNPGETKRQILTHVGIFQIPFVAHRHVK